MITRAFLYAALIWAATVGYVLAQETDGTLSRLLQRVEAYDWPAAISGARRADEVTRDIILWHSLRGSYGSFSDYQDFLARRPDWPGLPLLRQSGEASIPEDARPDQVIAYFKGQLPRTATGSLRLANALEARTADALAADEIRRAWLTHDLTHEEQALYLQRYGKVLAGLHDTRLDRLLWAKRLAQAEAMLPLASAEARAFGTARLELLRGADGVDALIAAIPARLADDAGLAHARFEWRLKRGRRDDAAALLIERSKRAGGLGEPWAWADKRGDLARLALQDNNPRLAYDLAYPHSLSEGEKYAELEWLAGYVALRFLNRPSDALNHFRRFRVAVDTPISLSRAGYWEGRALEALGQPDNAAHAFEFAAEYSSAFYGQLAAARVGISPQDALPLNRNIPDLQQTPLAGSSVLTAALALHKAGDKAQYRRFLRHLAEAGTPPEQAALGRLALEMGEPYTALYIAKYAADHGNLLMGAYFPTRLEMSRGLPIDPALVLAIVRRESEFDPGAVSHANAQGLMQVLPSTAKKIAEDIGVALGPDSLTTEPRKNIAVGSRYMANLAEEFNAYLPAMIGAYNAGPSRMRGWARMPGYGANDADRVVDWIEAVPFSETRNYIMRVLEAYQVYRVILGQDDDWTLPGMLTGQTRAAVVN